MAFRPPHVFEALWELPLSNGNVHRLQVVTFGRPPHGVIGVECREYMRPDMIARSPRPEAVIYHDGDGWGMGFDKLLRPEHLGWLIEHPDQVREALVRARSSFVADQLDGFGRMRDPLGS